MTRMYKIIVIILLVTLPIIAFYLGRHTKNRIVTDAPSTMTPSVTTTPTPSPQKNFAAHELNLVNELYGNTVPTSLLFGIKVPEFHQDWDCSSPSYNSDGFSIQCGQKACVPNRQARGFPPTPLSAEEDEQCTKELFGREIPPSLRTISIEGRVHRSDNAISDISTLFPVEDHKISRKGRSYSFNKISPERYVYLYTTVFYSPFPLSDRLSAHGGYDYTYGKYTISSRIAGDDLEQQVSALYESIIDAVLFIQPSAK